MIPVSPWARVSWISRAIRCRSSWTPASRAWVSSCCCRPAFSDSVASSLWLAVLSSSSACLRRSSSTVLGPPGPGVGQRDGHVHGHDDQVDHHAGRGVLVDAVGLRGGGQQPHRGRAEQPPRPHQVPDHEEVDGERVDPEQGVVEDQERAEHDQHGDEDRHHPRAAPPGGVQRVHPQHPRGGQRAQDEPGELGVRARLAEREGQQEAEDQRAVGQDIQHRVVTLAERSGAGLRRHGTGHLRPPH